MSCPVCNDTDRVRFVFVDYTRDGETTTENPSNLHFLYVCPSFHVYDEKGQQVGQADELTA